MDGGALVCLINADDSNQPKRMGLSESELPHID